MLCEHIKAAYMHIDVHTHILYEVALREGGGWSNHLYVCKGKNYTGMSIEGVTQIASRLYTHLVLWNSALSLDEFSSKPTLSNHIQKVKGNDSLISSYEYKNTYITYLYTGAVNSPISPAHQTQRSTDTYSRAALSDGLGRYFLGPSDGATFILRYTFLCGQCYLTRPSLCLVNGEFKHDCVYINTKYSYGPSKAR